MFHNHNVKSYGLRNSIIDHFSLIIIIDTDNFKQNKYNNNNVNIRFAKANLLHLNILIIKED